jgi:hypothetical protein
MKKYRNFVKEITQDGICYYTDTSRVFKDSDIGVLIYNTMEAAKASDEL